MPADEPAPDAKRERSPLAIAAAIAVLLLLPVAYVLSIGPAAWLQRHGIDEGNQFLGPIYAPIQRLAEHSQEFCDFMRWWLSLWGA